MGWFWKGKRWESLNPIGRLWPTLWGGGGQKYMFHYKTYQCRSIHMFTIIWKMYHKYIAVIELKIYWQSWHSFCVQQWLNQIYAYHQWCNFFVGHYNWMVTFKVQCNIHIISTARAVTCIIYIRYENLSNMKMSPIISQLNIILKKFCLKLGHRIMKRYKIIWWER